MEGSAWLRTFSAHIVDFGVALAIPLLTTLGVAAVRRVARLSTNAGGDLLIAAALADVSTVVLRSTPIAWTTSLEATRTVFLCMAIVSAVAYIVALWLEQILEEHEFYAFASRKDPRAAVKFQPARPYPWVRFGIVWIMVSALVAFHSFIFLVA